MIRRWLDAYKARVIARAKAAERTALLDKHGVLLRCLWCRQWGNTYDGGGIEPLREDGEDDGQYLMTCGCCGGQSAWDFAMAPVPVSLAAIKAPEPLTPDIQPRADAV